MKHQPQFWILIGLLLTLASCSGQSAAPKPALDVHLFPEDNNVPKAAVLLKDGYLVAGQKFTTKGDITQPSCLAKIGWDGKLLRQEFLGNNKSFGEQARLETIFRFDRNRLAQVGQKANALWVREVDGDMRVLKDTVMTSLPVDILFPPAIITTDSGFYVVANGGAAGPGINFVHNSLRQANRQRLKLENNPVPVMDFHIMDAAGANGLIYVVGSGCLKKDETGCIQQANFIVVYDTRNQAVTRTVALPQLDQVKFIKIADGRMYVGGQTITPLKDGGIKQYGITKNFSLSVAVLNTALEPVAQFTFDDTIQEYLHAMAVINGNIHLAGELFDLKTMRFYSLHVVFSPAGKLLQKYSFSDGAAENRITGIYPGPNGKILLLAKGRGWRIMTF